MSLGDYKPLKKITATKKMNFSNHNWPADLSSKQQNMYFKNTLHLIESRPQRLKTVYEYSGTLISLLQQTTNQITPASFYAKNTRMIYRLHLR